MENTDPSPVPASEPLEPLVVLHKDSDPVLDTEGGEAGEPIYEKGYDRLPNEIKVLINGRSDNLCSWESFVNEAIHVATMRTKGIPQTITELIQCLLEWREFVDASPCLPDLTPTERPSVQNLLSYLQQEALKDVHERLEQLTEDVKVLTNLNA